MKKNYEQPEVEVAQFEIEDIMTTSNPGGLDDHETPPY